MMPPKKGTPISNLKHDTLIQQIIRDNETPRKLLDETKKYRERKNETAQQRNERLEMCNMRQATLRPRQKEETVDIIKEDVKTKSSHERDSETIRLIIKEESMAEDGNFEYSHENPFAEEHCRTDGPPVTDNEMLSCYSQSDKGVESNGPKTKKNCHDSPIKETIQHLIEEKSMEEDGNFEYSHENPFPEEHFRTTELSVTNDQKISYYSQSVEREPSSESDTIYIYKSEMDEEQSDSIDSSNMTNKPVFVLKDLDGKPERCEDIAMSPGNQHGSTRQNQKAEMNCINADSECVITGSNIPFTVKSLVEKSLFVPSNSFVKNNEIDIKNCSARFKNKLNFIPIKVSKDVQPTRKRVRKRKNVQVQQQIPSNKKFSKELLREMLEKRGHTICRGNSSNNSDMKTRSEQALKAEVCIDDEKDSAVSLKIASSYSLVEDEASEINADISLDESELKCINDTHEKASDQNQILLSSNSEKESSEHTESVVSQKSVEHLYKCTLCGCTFKQRHSLSKHKLSQHSITVMY